MYLSMNQSFRDTFGKKGYKISLSAGMTCPNRDGTLGTRGCIFCSGAGEFAQKGTSVTQQIEEGAKRIEAKNKDGLYIAYFQDFTNTYAPLPRLRELFYEAINHPRVAVLSVATRPDCLPHEVLELLAELNRIKPVWVELGLQTIHETTASFLRRGYPLAVYDTAVVELHRRGITVITHLILGLPGETAEMVYQTVSHVGNRTDGVKFHLLHIVKGTDLEPLYRQGLISTMSFPAYARLLGECINRLPPHVVIHRLTGDGDKRTLLAPLWSGDKKHVLNSLGRFFAQENVRQGKLYLDK